MTLNTQQLQSLTTELTNELQTRFFIKDEDINKIIWINREEESDISDERKTFILKAIKEMITIADFITSMRTFNKDYINKEVLYEVSGKVMIKSMWCSEDIVINMRPVIRSYDNNMLNILTRLTHMLAVVFEDM